MIQNPFFPEIHGNFGFGCMRLPMKDGHVNYDEFCRIPDMFSSLNAHEAFHNWNTGYYYNNVITGEGHGKASACIRCGKCEKVCPQHLPIRELLKKVATTFER